MTNRAIIYARKSLKTDRAEEQSASVADQLLRGKRYAAENGMTVVGEHWDDGRSGLLDRTKRKGLNATLTQVEAGEADVIITLWTSRLSRDEQQRASILDELDASGVEWHTVADGGKVDRSTYAGYLNYGVRTIFDVAYSKQVGQNWKSAHEKRLESGLPKSTSHRFGYRYEFDTGTDGRRKNGRYVVHEDEAEVVQELYRKYVRGDGFRQLVVWLNAGGWRVRGTGKHAGKENEWTVRTLNRFMDSGFAAGYISRQEGLRDERMGSHETLIDADLWTAYEAMRKERAALGKQEGARGRWWLGGLVKCGVCSGPTFIDSFERKGSMVCCSNRRANPGSCTGTYILRTTVEGAVALWLGGHLDMLDTLSTAESKATADAAAAGYQDALAAQKRIIEGLSNLAVQKALGEVQPAVYVAAKAKMDKQLSAADKVVADAAVAINQAGAPDTDELRKVGDTGWTDDQVAALAQVLSRVEVSKDALTIFPATGDPVTWTRAELAPRCGVSDCDRKRYTQGLCKSHAMRSRNIAAEVFEALAARVAEDQPSITTDEVDVILEAARKQSTSVAAL